MDGGGGSSSIAQFTLVGRLVAFREPNGGMVRGRCIAKEDGHPVFYIRELDLREFPRTDLTKPQGWYLGGGSDGEVWIVTPSNTPHFVTITECDPPSRE